MGGSTGKVGVASTSGDAEDDKDEDEEEDKDKDDDDAGATEGGRGVDDACGALADDVEADDIGKSRVGCAVEMNAGLLCYNWRQTR